MKLCKSQPSRLHLCRVVTPPLNNMCSSYDIYSSDSEVPALGLWGI